MLNNYLSNTCTVTRKQTSLSAWGVSSITQTTIYTNIPCYVWQSKGSVYDSTLAVYTKENTLNMIVWPERLEIKQGDTITLTDSDLGNMWSYEVQTQPKINRDPQNKPDSIQFIIKSI
jgi:hypothetical protein